MIRRRRFVCWITKATDTRSKYVIVAAFLRQQWSQERVTMLRYTCSALPVLCYPPTYLLRLQLLSVADVSLSSLQPCGCCFIRHSGTDVEPHICHVCIVMYV